MLLSSSANQKYICLKFDDCGEVNIFADRNMVYTILRNLISNAIKFTNNKGSIIIEVQNFSDNVSIGVTDNGVGIAKDKLDTLFTL